MDQHQLYGATLDRVYRLALLATGSPRAAARLARRAYARRDPAATDPEANLAHGLLAARAWPWPWQPPAGAASAGLTPADLSAMRDALAAATPAARLALGAPHLVAIAIDDGPAPQAPAPDCPWPRRARDRHALLATLGRAWGLLPAGVAYADVYEQALLLAGALPEEHAAELRALLLDHTRAAEQARATREGLRRAEARLATAMPALFGGEAPAELREELARPAQGRRRPLGAEARLRLALVAAVALIALAVIVMPRGAPPAGVVAGRTVDDLPPAALARAALARLERPTGEGVLHERFAAVAPGYSWSLERWQELEPPRRFRVEVRDEQERLRFALASDGRQQVQQRRSSRNGDTAVLGVDYGLSAEELDALLPTLRQQPDSLLLVGSWNSGFNLERYYLNQAIEAPLEDLGATVVAGRQARLLAFQSAAPTPPDPDAPYEAPDSAPARVLLAIDTATHALLEARVLPAASAATGEVARPWRAEVYELLPGAPDHTFRLPPPATAATEKLVSARLIGEATSEVVALAEATAPAGAPLYFPADGAGISYGITMDRSRGSVILVRETAAEVVQVIPFADGPGSFAEGLRSTRQSGALTYEVVYPEHMPPGRLVSLATVYLDAERRRGVHLIYGHTHAPRAEREALLDALIQRLAPLGDRTPG